MADARQQQIDLLLSQLAAARPRLLAEGLGEALEETVILLNAMRSAGSYWRWIRTRLPQLHPDAMRELNELLPEWDEPIHQDLLDLEQKRFPLFLTPVIDLLARKVAQADRPMVVLDLGSGAMEIERRLLGQIAGQDKSLTLVGLDASPAAQAWARTNLRSSGCPVLETDFPELQRRLANPEQGVRVILCRADAAQVQQLAPGSADVVLHSFMRHHLTITAQQALDQTLARVGKSLIEYDGYRNWISLVCSSLATWKQPAFMAAAVMSYVRYPWKADLYARWGRERLRFYRNGCYLAYSG